MHLGLSAQQAACSGEFPRLERRSTVAPRLMRSDVQSACPLAQANASAELPFSPSSLTLPPVARSTVSVGRSPCSAASHIGFIGRKRTGPVRSSTAVSIGFTIAASMSFQNAVLPTV